MPDSALISLTGIQKRYDLGEQVVYALRDINLQILRGEYVALMGPSGSGKSTLMNIIGCLDTPTAGTYILNGKEVSSMTDGELSHIRNMEIGFVFQTFNLLGRLTALDNVALPLVYAGVSKKERTERAKAALNDVGLSDRMSHKPNELSGGQRQRVAVARSLINNPSILLADEPTGNLDTNTSKEIMALFDEIHAKGNTIILVTHEEDIARYAKRMVRVRDGVIENNA
ncbi:MAG: ABC transporter ATP-binding protein [Bacteroidetes bacterium]|jgi:putative ABC transport system ATP-binding protein|nr:ABC transporter ATP-binding protein [Bacteroidota bacterium]